MKTRVLALLALLVIFPSQTFAVGPLVGTTCKFQWTEPQTNADTTNLTDLAEYRLFISQTPGVYGTTPAKVILAPLANPATGSSLTTPCPTSIPQGQNYAVMVAVDLAGNASVASNEAPFVFDTVVPGAPIVLTPLQ